MPNQPGQTLNFINTGSSVIDENQYFGRIDEKLSDKDTLFFRARNARCELSSNVTINPNFGSLGYPTNQNFVLAETHIFSATW